MHILKDTFPRPERIATAQDWAVVKAGVSL